MSRIFVQKMGCTSNSFDLLSVHLFSPPTSQEYAGADVSCQILLCAIALPLLSSHVGIILSCTG